MTTNSDPVPGSSSKVENCLFPWKGDLNDRAQYDDFRSKLFEMIDSQGLGNKIRKLTEMEALEQDEVWDLFELTENEKTKSAQIKVLLSKALGQGTAYGFIRTKASLVDCIAVLNEEYDSQDPATKGTNVSTLFSLKPSEYADGSAHLGAIDTMVDERLAEGATPEDLKIGAALLTADEDVAAMLSARLGGDSATTFADLMKAVKVQENTKRGRREDDTHQGRTVGTGGGKRQKRANKEPEDGDAMPKTADELNKLMQNAAKQGAVSALAAHAKEKGKHYPDTRKPFEKYKGGKRGGGKYGGGGKGGGWDDKANRWCHICQIKGCHTTDRCRYNKKGGGGGDKGGGKGDPK